MKLNYEVCAGLLSGQHSYKFKQKTLQLIRDHENPGAFVVTLGRSERGDDPSAFYGQNVIVRIDQKGARLFTCKDKTAGKITMFTKKCLNALGYSVSSKGDRLFLDGAVYEDGTVIPFEV